MKPKAKKWNWQPARKPDAAPETPQGAANEDTVAQTDTEAKAAQPVAPQKALPP